jgi:hypothetical protein
MSMKLVMPPATAAADSLAMQPLWVRPGSRKCTWSSIMPGSSQARRVDLDLRGKGDAAGDPVDAAVGDEQIASDDAALVHQTGVADEDASGHVQNSFCSFL